MEVSFPPALAVGRKGSSPKGNVWGDCLTLCGLWGAAYLFVNLVIGLKLVESQDSARRVASQHLLFRHL